jgi:hypothetical protein
VTKVEKVVIMVKPEDLELDQILYNVALYLFQTEQEEAAELLLMSELDEYRPVEIDYFDPRHYEDPEAHYTIGGFLVTLSGPASVKEAIGSSLGVDDNEFLVSMPANSFEEEDSNIAPAIRSIIEQGFAAVLRKPVVIDTHLQLVVDSEGDWREHLRRLAKGPKVTNQGLKRKTNDHIIVWNHLNFRSQAERKIAEALDKRGVLFLPNCVARLGPVDHRHNKEPDFLICHEGKWGVLEVDGTFYHQKTAAQDDERTRQFLRHGIRVIQRFTDERCRNEPEEVVNTFLDILKQNG